MLIEYVNNKAKNQILHHLFPLMKNCRRALKKNFKVSFDLFYIQGCLPWRIILQIMNMYVVKKSNNVFNI